MDKGSVSVTITPGSIVAAVAVGLLLWLVFYLKGLVLIVLTAVVLASAVEPGVRIFMKRGFPRVFAVLSLYGVIISVIVASAYLFFPPLVQEASVFIVNLPQFVDSMHLDAVLATNPAFSHQSLITPESVAGIFTDFQNIFLSSGQGAFHMLTQIFGGLISFFLILVMSVYFAIAETGVDDFLRIVVPAKNQEYALNLWKRSHHKIGLWIQGQLILSLIVGILGYLWLSILQVPYAFLIAIFAGLAELIPIFGSLTSGTLATIIAASYGGVPLALLTAGGFLIINQLQANLIYPLVVKKIVGVPPLLVIIAMIAGAQLAGFLGILMAVPVAAALQELVSDIRASKERQLAQMKE